MAVLKKLLQLSKLTASSILKKEEPEMFKNSDFFSDSDKRYIIKQLTDEELIKERANLLSSIDRKEGWSNVENRIVIPFRKIHIWKYASVAAVLFIFAAFYFSTQDIIKNNIKEKSVVVKEVISPGTDKAVLVLAGGQKVILGKGTVYNAKGIHSSGTEIKYDNVNSAKGAVAYNYLTIPRGGQFCIKLADGTKVWLNSDSKLKFPTSFTDGKLREVELVYGEAYFDVSPSGDHKGSRFKVFTGVQNVEVLGTEFNIKAYQDDQAIYTTLVEGKISFSSTTETKIMKPGEQSILNVKKNTMHVSEVDVFNEVSWKEGVFSFQQMSLKDIMKVLERWYDIKTVFKRPETEHITFNGILDKNQKIDEILTIISNTNKIPYEINQKTVIFK